MEIRGRVTLLEVSGDRSSSTAYFTLTQQPSVRFTIATTAADTISEMLFGALVDMVAKAYISNITIEITADSNHRVTRVTFPTRG